MVTQRDTPTPVNPTAGDRLPGLDGLRVVGVLIVVLGHQGLAPYGWVSVQTFFVLSGYLITRLLWEARNQSLRDYLIGFYGRRALRIFPLYFTVLLAFWVVTVFTTKGMLFKPALPYLATYTYNIWATTGAYQESRYFSHFWSLCVEEQFYLLWPILIYLCRRGGIKRVLLSIVLLGPVIRLAEVLLLHSLPGVNPLTDLAVYVSTPTYFDGFALGAYVALFPLGGLRKALLASLALLTITSYLALTSQHGLRDTSGMGPAYILIWGYSLVNVFSALLIDCLVFRKLAHGFFNARPMRYLGKISYGLYVFHFPVQTALEQVIPNSNLYARIAIQIVITVTLSALSFRLLEKPFLLAKDRWFPTHTSSAVLQPARATE